MPKVLAAIVALVLGTWGFVEWRAASSNAKAREIWAQHEKVVVRELNGSIFTSESFGESALFFQRVTGIRVRMGAWTYGFQRVEGTAEDFHRVKQWYTENADKLYYDASEGEVRVRGQEPRREKEEPREDPSLRTHLPG